MVMPTCVTISENLTFLKEFAARKELMIKMISANQLRLQIQEMLTLVALLITRTRLNGGLSVPKQIKKTVEMVRKLRF